LPAVLPVTGGEAQALPWASLLLIAAGLALLSGFGLRLAHRAR